MLGICQIVPGPNVTNLAVCIGSRFCGVRGAIASVLGLSLGPICIVILLALLYDHFSYLESVRGILRPMKVRPWASTISAKPAFSDRKP